jgi:hypothetical protein
MLAPIFSSSRIGGEMSSDGSRSYIPGASVEMSFTQMLSAIVSSRLVDGDDAQTYLVSR